MSEMTIEQDLPFLRGWRDDVLKENDPNDKILIMDFFENFSNIILIVVQYF